MELLDYTHLFTAELVRQQAKQELGRIARNPQPQSTDFILRDDDFVVWQDPRHFDLGPCHIWIWGLRSGYARYSDHGRNEYVHRFVNNTPEGMDTLHSCRNRCCINRRHLRSGTRRDNLLDMGRDIDAGLIDTHDKRKVSSEECREIRRLYEAGYKQLELAEIFQLNQAAISNHINGPGFGCSHEI